MEEQVVIVGAGIAGLATALALKRVGIKALVLEKADSLRTTGAALSLLPNAWIALDSLGVSHKLKPLYPPLSTGSITNVPTGSVKHISLSNRGGEGPSPVHRKMLLEALAEELPTDSIRFSSHITSIETQQLPGAAASASLAVVHLKDGTTIKSKVLIGCDGLHSVVAQWLGLSAPIHSGRSAVRGLAVYPQGHGFGRSVEQFIDVGKRGGMVPLNENEVFWFLTCQGTFAGDHRTYDPITIQKEVLENHASNFPTLYLDVVRHSDLSSLSWAPLMLRNPWNIIVGNLSKANVTVAGDAMHPMTPDLAQGGCCALEDAVVLGRQIGNSFIRNGKSLVAEEMASVLNGYAKERRWRAAGLITGSYVSGWVQQSGQNWWRKLLRVFFYSYLIVALAKLIRYNCGKLPEAEAVVDDMTSEESKKVD
ncbi:Monooxygenase 3 [Linum perenne]